VHDWSVLVKDDPGKKREDQHETRVDNGSGTDVTLKLTHLYNPMGDQGHDQTTEDTEHPGRKIGAENIDRGRMMTKYSHHEESDNKQNKAGDDKSQNWSRCFHPSNV
jgi:hypothetical protein